MYVAVIGPTYLRSVMEACQLLTHACRRLPLLRLQQALLPHNRSGRRTPPHAVAAEPRCHARPYGTPVAAAALTALHTSGTLEPPAGPPGPPPLESVVTISLGRFEELTPGRPVEPRYQIRDRGVPFGGQQVVEDGLARADDADALAGGERDAELDVTLAG